ncbi:MAG: DUF4349 domain-containing protein [Solobacterium sp.]|nr:DUF4349 domain-containing protein [Solobacterium sp.]
MKKGYVVLIAAVLLAGCSRGKAAAARTDQYEAPVEAAEAEYGYTETTESKSAAAEEGYLAENDMLSETEPQVTGEKLVYTGNMRIETLTYDETVSQLLDLTNKYKGIIENQNENVNDYYWRTDAEDRSVRSMSLVLRIPTKNFSTFLDDMQGTGKVMSRSVNVENITRQYNDNSVLITSLETQEERLLEMMEKAETIEDMITVEQRLTEVQTELNRLKMNKSSMDTDIEYSTVYLTVNEVRQYQDSRPDFLHQLQEAFTGGFSDFAYALGGLLLGLTKGLPFLACLAVIGWIVYRFLRKKNFFRKGKE